MEAEATFSPKLIKLFKKFLKKQSLVDRLSDTEKEYLSFLFFKGVHHKEFAKIKEVSEHKIKMLKKAIYGKIFPNKDTRAIQMETRFLRMFIEFLLNGK